jgi:cyclophilin family peptidyl-prolyl cis-trans isomerase
MEKPKLDFKEGKKILLLVVGLLVVSVLGIIFMNSSMYNTNMLPEDNKYTGPEQFIEEGVDYQVILKTNFGNIKIELFEDETPVTVNSFLFLASKNYFKNIIFHRVVNGFVIQTGDPTGTGTGGPGYVFKDEITDRKYKGYSVGMANSGPNTNGSQFFITSGSISDSNIDALNGGYTLFGEVIEGFAIVDSIERVTVDSNDKPVNDVVIESVQILEN